MGKEGGFSFGNLDTWSSANKQKPPRVKIRGSIYKRDIPPQVIRKPDKPFIPKVKRPVIKKGQ